MASNNKQTKSKVIEKPDSDSENDISSDENDTKLTSKNIKSSEKFDDDSEEVENISESESEHEIENQKKTKEKKIKESFDELMTELETERENIKLVDKEIDEYEKNLKIKKKIRYDHERKINIILKKLPKSHNEQITKTRKEKPKRKGNVNGGFCKDQLVPEILVKFIGLEQGIIMKRPQVMSALSNKLISLGLKKGQDTILNKAAVNALSLDSSYEGKIIKFGEFQTFLKGFYPVIEEKNIVSIS